MDVFLDALDLLEDVPVLAIMGDGPERPELEARVRAGPLRDRVRFRGVVQDAGALFTAFDAFVLSSRTEGRPMVLLEAMAAGVPIVATCVGGIPEVVSPGEALLVPSQDVGAMADALRSVRSHPSAARRRLGDGFSVPARLTEGIEDL